MGTWVPALPTLRGRLIAPSGGICFATRHFIFAWKIRAAIRSQYQAEARRQLMERDTYRTISEAALRWELRFSMRTIKYFI